MDDCDVLVVGAGPSGLVLALWLARLGVRVRIIDKAAEAGTTSRAIAVQARTLELYRQVGLADAVVDAGLKFAAANLWTSGAVAGRVPFGEMGTGQSPFPYIIAFAQDEHERLLAARLAAQGIVIERPVELLGYTDEGDHVVAQLRRPDGVELRCRATYLAGCDGAHSAVREKSDLAFPGGTYEHLFYVADVEARGAMMNGELHVALDEADFLALFPFRGAGHGRLIGTVRDAATTAGRPLAWPDVSRSLLQRLPLDVTRVSWFSTYRVHHRVVERFRDGRVFLVGDAAHVHSPVGGQGMNTGIADAVNLAWKLAAVLRRRADARLLDTYDPERRAFARRLVATTDRVFTFANNDGAVARQVRTRVMPRLLPRLFSIESVRRAAFRLVSQTGLSYRRSALSVGRAGGVHAGDRLPWVAPAQAGEADNFVPLGSVEWQIHVYGTANDSLRAGCARLGIPLHAFPWSPACERAGLQRDALHLVRPDGYVAFAAPSAPADLGALERYCADWSLRAA